MFTLDTPVSEPPISNDFFESVLSRRIKSTDKIKSSQFIMKIDGVNKISKNDISGFIGRAKSRKSFAVTMFAAALCGGLNLYGKFQSLGKYKVLYIDTEQSDGDVQLVSKRINYLVGAEENLFMYGMKPFNPQERINGIGFLLDRHKPDVLIIDGIRDLLYDINNAVECTTVMSIIQKWNVNYDVHVSCVLHQNKADGNARGHIGTELDNKSQMMVRITQNENDKTISEFKEIFGRGKGTEAFNFFVNEQYADFGIPEVIHGFSYAVNDLEEAPY